MVRAELLHRNGCLATGCPVALRVSSLFRWQVETHAGAKSQRQSYTHQLAPQAHPASACARVRPVPSASSTLLSDYQTRRIPTLAAQSQIWRVVGPTPG